MIDDRPGADVPASATQDRFAAPRWFSVTLGDNVEKAQQAVTKAGGRVLAAPKKDAQVAASKRSSPILKERCSAW